MLPHRPLGASGLEVSALSLGSWRTYERMSRDAGIAVMSAAREAGIDFLDDARYDDETGTAPMRTGYSEVVFGELFRASGWRRDEVVVANKLWWEFWPEESAARELDGSLGRMGLDHLDLAYAAAPPEGLEVAEIVGSVAELIDAGKLRAWGVLNWEPALVRAAADHARAHELPPPCAAQLPYNVVLREAVEGDEPSALLEDTGVRVVASMSLWYGALTGKYSRPAASGRLADELESPQLRAALDAVEPLQALAARLDTTPAALAIAFALANEHVASVLFGATRPDQIVENVAAAEVLARLSDADLDELRAIGS
jgi:aryl-alcohol dehydrogenase-like predicted oxidoreductase